MRIFEGSIMKNCRTFILSRKNHRIILNLLVFLSVIPFCHMAVEAQTSVRFAAIGDYGWEGQPEQDVANLVKSWKPDFIITLGDNNYIYGADSSIDRNIGQYYHEYIYQYKGTYGQGDTLERFFPCLGNHDYLTPGALPYLNYFTLPGNNRYYDFVKGPAHFFVINSNPQEPDGIKDTSKQAKWLEQGLQSSTSLWKIVYFHHPPYESGSTGEPNPRIFWPFKRWGASVVLSGHEHDYERLIEDGFPYFVNGSGGRSLIPFDTTIDTGSQKRYVGDYGAMLIEANQDSIVFQFFTRTDSLIDRYVIKAGTNGIHGDGAFFPQEYYLCQNYPNPYNSSTEINYILPVESHVHLKLFNLFGQEIDKLVDEQKFAGKYSVNYDVKGIASGIYFYTLSAGNFQQTQKMVVLK